MRLLISFSVVVIPRRLTLRESLSMNMEADVSPAPRAGLTAFIDRQLIAPDFGFNCTCWLHSICNQD